MQKVLLHLFHGVKSPAKEEVEFYTVILHS